MLTANKASLGLAMGLCAAVFASPSFAQSRQNQNQSHESTAREAVIQECNREAQQDFPWFEDMNRATAYKACMMSHGQPELP
jgi:hypothetical protein